MKDIISKINKAFENKVRLGIMSALTVNQSLDFQSMKKLLQITDGNLSSNASVLEKLEYIEIKKDYIGKKTSTGFQATEKGKTAFKEHIKALEELINASKV